MAVLFDAAPRARAEGASYAVERLNKKNGIIARGPGGGKTHLASAIGLALVGWRVLFARTSDLAITPPNAKS